MDICKKLLLLFCPFLSLVPSSTSQSLSSQGNKTFSSVQFSSVQSLSRVQLFATPWIIACQACLFITNSRSLLKLVSIESVIPSRHLILCRPLLLLPPIPPSIRVFSNESTLCIRWPPRTDLLWDGLVGSLCSSRDSSRVFSSTTIQKHQLFGAQLSS